MTTERVTVLGAGAWGSTLAQLLSENNHQVILWDRSAEAVASLAKHGHPRGVPELALSSSIQLETDLEKALRDATVVLLVVPSHAIAPVCRTLNSILDHLPPAQRPVIALASKGLDPNTLQTLSDVAEANLPTWPLGIVSGPCIAREVAKGMPSTVVAASSDRAVAERLQATFGNDRLRVYIQDDMRGVELGGALKNVIAIAAGISDGLGYGANSKAALMARGLAEMARFAIALGGRIETIYGLSGLGDLAVTCFSPHSRNRTFGELIGQGESPDAARSAIGMVVEGEPCARSVLTIGQQYALDLPVTEVVVAILDGEVTPQDAVQRLMQREMKDEQEPTLPVPANGF